LLAIVNSTRTPTSLWTVNLGEFRPRISAATVETLVRFWQARAKREQRRQAIAVYSDLDGDMRRWRAEGASLAKRINDAGRTTRNGANCGKVQVKRALERV